MRNEIDRVAIIQRAIQLERDTATVLIVLQSLPTTELAHLFPELVRLASKLQGGAEVVRNAIHSLPRAWVVAHIEAIAELLLEREDAIDEYRRLLELYCTLDRDLTLRLAKKAIRHPNAEISEAGEDFLKMLESSEL
jgi:hypothetical protein